MVSIKYALSVDVLGEIRGHDFAIIRLHRLPSLPKREGFKGSSEGGRLQAT